MKSKILLLVFIPFVVFATPVKANMSTGVLLEICQEDAGPQVGYCLGFINGAYTQAVFLTTAMQLQGLEIEQFCVPEESNLGQFQKIFVKWASQNPEKHHLPAAVNVVTAVRNAFPCK